MDAKPNSEAWFISSFIGRVIQTEGTLWSCFLLSSIDNGMDKNKFKVDIYAGLTDQFKIK